MKTPSSLRVGILATGLMVLASSVYAQGKVVVSHDEWFTGNGYLGSYGDQRFMGNTLNWFGLQSSNNVLVQTTAYSGFYNGFYQGSALDTYLTGLGLNVTYSATATNYSAYNAVLISGDANAGAYNGLANYVFGGGNVFVEGGTGAWSDGTLEATANNIFLNALGLTFTSPWNGIGPIDVSTAQFDQQGPFGAALFTGVNSVYANNGNSVVLTVSPVSGVTSQVWADGESGQGVFGAAEVAVTPEPATLLLFGTGLGLTGLGVIRRRRRNKIEQ